MSWSLANFEDNPSPEAGEASPSSMQSGSQEPSGINGSAIQKPISAAAELSKRLYGSVGRGRSRRTGGRTIKDFTEEWINQYLSGHPRTERTNWLSDDSETSETGSFLTARNYLGEDQPEGWLGLDDDSKDEDVLKTPTAKSFFAQKARDIGAKFEGSRLRAKHIPKKSTDTLKPEDFWDFGYDQDAVPTTMPDKETLDTSQLGSPAEEAQSLAAPVDKPLPPPPTTENETPSQQPPSDSVLPPRKSTTASLQRPRKKVGCKGKACYISLPLDDYRGSAESGYKLLTREDVVNRLREWEEKGYNIQGFNSFVDTDFQSRPTYPDPGECKEHFDQRDFRISFPNKKEWEAYVNFLQEEKLRALGVTLGDPEPAPTPNSLPMSQNSSQFPLHAISPPIPTSSAASNQFNMQPNTFSPAFGQPANPTSAIGSLGSPASPFGIPTSTAFPGQPNAFGTDIPYGPGFPFPFQPSPHGHGTFTPQSLYNPRQDGVSPVGTTTLPNLNSMLPTVSPFGAEDPNHFPGMTNMFSQLKSPPSGQQEPHQTDASHLISPPSEESPVKIEAESETIESSSGPEIVQPAPRGHTHNVSESLQKDVEQADYHLEDSIRRQLDDDEEPRQESSLTKPGWAIPEGNEGRQSGPSDANVGNSQTSHDHGFGEQYRSNELSLDETEINTNPSLSGSPAFGNVVHFTANPSHKTTQANHNTTQQGQQGHHQGHQSKSSLSALNVEARDFDPENTFPANNFSFGAHSFQPAAGFGPANSIFSPNAGQQPSHSATSSGLNVSGRSLPPESKRGSVSSNTNFQFSSASFNVEAPVFNPGRSLKIQSGGNTPKPEPSAKPQPKIFGDIDPNSLIVKPARRSKAIPIIKPDEVKQNQIENSRDAQEKSEGNNTENLDQGRQKRARRGDQNSVFAAVSPGDHNKTTVQSIDDSKANQSRLDSNAKAVSTEPAAQPSQVQSKESAANQQQSSTESPASQTWQPFEFRNGQDAVAFQAASPESPGKHAVTSEKQGVKSLIENTPQVSDTDSVSKKQQPQSEAISHSENADQTTQSSKENAITPSLPPKKTAGLEASRYAVDSPSPSPEREAFNGSLPPSQTQPTLGVSPANEATHDAAGSDDDTEHDSLDVQQIDAVMTEINADESGVVGVERRGTPPGEFNEVNKERLSPLKGPQLISTHPDRSNAPSPSTQGAPHHIDDLPKSNAGTSLKTSMSPVYNLQRDGASTIRQLKPENEYISDWDDMISSSEEGKLHYRSRFFDRHVNNIVGNILENRLDPVERSLGVIQQSVTMLASRSTSQVQSQERSVSAEPKHSDADDEDDEEATGYRSISPFSKKDKRTDKIRQAVLDALATNQASRKDPVPTVDLSGIQDALAELKLLSAPKPTQERGVDIRRAVEDAISNHPRLNDHAAATDAEHDAERLKMQIEGLQSMLRLADERAEKEYNSRRELQESLTESQKLLRIAEEDAGKQRDFGQSIEKEFNEFKERKLPEVERIEKKSFMLEEQQETLGLTLSELSKKNIALEETLDEYRVSGDHWRTETDNAKAENKELRRTINELKDQVEESMRMRQTLRGRFDRLQEDMVSATQDIARDRSLWRHKEEDLNSKYDSLRAAYDREVRLREKLELDVGDLEQQEKEATKLRFIFGQSQQENSRLEEMVATLRRESNEYQTKAIRFEREFNDARESSRVEIQRVRTSMESDVEAANSQVNCVRAELESQITGLQHQLDNVKMDADTAKARHELLLEEARDSKSLAVAEVTETKDAALQEQRLLHERVLNDLRERHARALHNASEDKQRGEAHLSELMNVRDEKIAHLEDKVCHLEEKLQIAKSAARAAAQAAQNAKGFAVPDSPTKSVSPSLPFSKGSEVPEKISPQALRESIMVLQDQLQQREGRIEELEQEISSVDKDAPQKVKEKETEINWLRELLGVRTDDLQDIINTLSRPSFDKNAVRDAVIRLKANIQMQQQAKERAMTGGGQSFPSLASISNIASSPRSFPLAAAAAWGNWRKTRENSVSSATGESRETQPRESHEPTKDAPDQRTPSKAASTTSQTFLSGLLTPPSSNVRTPNNQTAPPAPLRLSAQRYASETRPLRSFSGNGPRKLSARQAEKMPRAAEPPKTPPLLRRSSYDHDAEATNYDEEDIYGDDNDSVVVTSSEESKPGPSEEEPFGPTI